MHKRIVMVSFLVGLLCPSSVAAKDYNKLGKEGYAHWRCAAIGMLSTSDKDREHANTLFLSGHELLSEFVTDLVAGKITDEDTTEVPVGIGWYLTAGPSVEFRLGYMWAQFSKTAYDDTWPTLENPNFDAKKYIQEMDAQNRFSSGNCDLL